MATAKKEMKVTEISEAESLAEKIVEEAKKRAEEILLKAEKEAAQKSQKEPAESQEAPAPVEPKVKPGDELVEIELFKDNDRYKDDVFVSVNGERCLIKRGVKVKVKKKFADALDDAARQNKQAADLQLMYEERFRERAREVGIDV